MFVSAGLCAIYRKCALNMYTNILNRVDIFHVHVC